MIFFVAARAVVGGVIIVVATGIHSTVAVVIGVVGAGVAVGVVVANVVVVVVSVDVGVCGVVAVAFVTAVAFGRVDAAGVADGVVGQRWCW